MKSQFTLFQSHIDLAHHHWQRLLKPGDRAIDATCGNGHDTLFLAQLGCLDRIYSLDIQEEALMNARQRVEAEAPDQIDTVTFLHQSHEKLPQDTIKLIVYNLGFLPGGNKEVTTRLNSSLASVEQAVTLLSSGGVISITCYSGHPEGAKEEEALRERCKQLTPTSWSYTHHFWSNRNAAPSLITLQKKI